MSLEERESIASRVAWDRTPLEAIPARGAQTKRTHALPEKRSLEDRHMRGPRQPHGVRSDKRRSQIRSTKFFFDEVLWKVRVCAPQVLVLQSAPLGLGGLFGGRPLGVSVFLRPRVASLITRVPRPSTSHQPVEAFCLAAVSLRIAYLCWLGRALALLRSSSISYFRRPIVGP